MSSNHTAPPIWIGHVTLQASDVAETSTWLARLGLRLIMVRDEVAVLELRGGTHLVVLPADEPIPAGTPASFDLMVEDIEDSHRSWTALGLMLPPIERGEIHDSFNLTDPSGQVITVNSNHVVGVV